MSLAGRVSKEVTTKLHTVVRAHERGDHPARSGPIARPGSRSRSCAGARRPAAGYASNAARYPDDTAIVDELGTLTLQGGPGAHQRARARARRTTASASATAWRSCAATTAASSTPYVACSKLGANALFLNTAFSGPQLTDVAKREEPKAVIYDQEFAEVAQGRRHAPQALHRLARARGGQAEGPARSRT